MKFLKICADSLKELKSAQAIAKIGILIALALICSYLMIPIGSFLKISFKFIPYCIIGFLYGPMCSMFSACVGDILGFMIKPTGAFNPAFTLIEMVAGFLYGYFVYRKKVTLKNVILTKLSVNVFVNIILNTLALAIFVYGIAGIQPLILTRVIKNIAVLPFEVIILYYILKFVQNYVKK